MPVIRQTLTGLPPQNGATAFMPLRAMTPSVMDISRSQGTPEDQVGQPGTQGIPAPYPMGTPPGPAQPYFLGGTNRSWNAPARWYPSLFYRAQHLSRGIGGVAVYSDNLMPMPAVDPRGLPVGGIGPAAFAAYRGLTPTRPARPNRWVGGLGQRQVLWPKRTPEWPPTWPQTAGAGG